LKLSPAFSFDLKIWSTVVVLVFYLFLLSVYSGILLRLSKFICAVIINKLEEQTLKLGLLEIVHSYDKERRMNSNLIWKTLDSKKIST